MKLFPHQKVLMVVAALFAGTLVVELWFGMALDLMVQAPQDSDPRTRVKIEGPPSLALPARRSSGAFAERPLFEASRQPRQATPEPEETSVEVANIKLMGVVITDNETIAILRAQGSAAPVRARTGQTVGGWRVVQITENSVLLRSDDSVQRVSLAYDEAVPRGSAKTNTEEEAGSNGR